MALTALRDTLAHVVTCRHIHRVRQMALRLAKEEGLEVRLALGAACTCRPKDSSSRGRSTSAACRPTPPPPRRPP